MTRANDDVLRDPLLVLDLSCYQRMHSTRYNDMFGLLCVDLMPAPSEGFTRPFKLALTRRDPSLSDFYGTVLAVLDARDFVIADAYVVHKPNASNRSVALRGLPLLHLCNARY